MDQGMSTFDSMTLWDSVGHRHMRSNIFISCIDLEHSKHHHRYPKPKLPLYKKM